MISFDWWYDRYDFEECDITVNFIPDQGVYRGNIYRKGSNSCIGDFISDSSTEIEKYWPDAFREEDETSKREMIEMIIARLKKDKDFENSMLRKHRHDLEDAYADNKKYMIEHWSERCEENQKNIEALNNMIDFMQSLHYEEVNKNGSN